MRRTASRAHRPAGADDVDGEHAVQAGGRHLVHPRLHVDNAGVVHERRDGAERTLAVDEHPQHVVLDGHIPR
jgi:hypothetical protein